MTNMTAMTIDVQPVKVRAPLKARRARPDMQDYDNRNYVAHLLDDRHFDAYNGMPEGGSSTVTLATMGCIDALDEIPAGSMKVVFHSANHHQPSLFDRSICERGFSLAEVLERDAACDEMIDEILNEEATS